MKKIIDADNQKILELFDVKDSKKIKDKYIAMNKWDDIEFDYDGDLILWEEL